MITTSALNNGVHIISNYQASATATSVSIWLHNGSRHQHDNQNGYAHFLEHLLFKGTQALTAKQLADAFECMGGQINAQTGRELTGFYGTVPNHDAKELLKLLTEMLTQPRFNEQDVSVEKDIVLQEMAMIKDDPEEVLVETTTTNIWPNHPIGWPILGDEEQIRSATAKDLHAYLQSLLQGERLWVVSSGGMSHQTLTEACQALGQLPQGSAPLSTSPSYTRKNSELQYGIAQSCLQWDMPVFNHTHPDFAALVVSNHILGGGTNSRLFQRVREERGLVYGIQSHLEIYSDCGLWSIQTSCDPENKQACFDEVEQCCETIINTPPTQNEIVITQRYIKASLILEAQNLEATMERLVREAFYLKHIDTLEERLKKVDSVTPADVSRVIKSCWQNRSYGELSPEQEDD